jgi:transposase
MVVLGVDPHKRTHTVVAVDEAGRQVGELTVGARSEGHLHAVAWARQFGEDRRWAVEDARQVAGRLVRDLLGTGERVSMVPPKLMAQCRASARTRGKSDPIDALAVARAAVREPGLPMAQLDGPALDTRLLLDHRENLVNERTRMVNRLRWHLHDLDPDLAPMPRSLDTLLAAERLRVAVAGLPESVRRDLALELLDRIWSITKRAYELERDIGTRVKSLAAQLLAIPGVGVLTAAKLFGETGGVRRFRSPAAFAMAAGVAPIPVWSGNRERFRLNRGGNRQLNAALHRAAVTQLRVYPPARQLVDRRSQSGDTTAGALRVLKRHLADVVFVAMCRDEAARTAFTPEPATPRAGVDGLAGVPCAGSLAGERRPRNLSGDRAAPARPVKPDPGAAA